MRSGVRIGCPIRPPAIRQLSRSLHGSSWAARAPRSAPPAESERRALRVRLHAREFPLGAVSKLCIQRSVVVALSAVLSAAPEPAAHAGLPSELPGSTLPVLHESTYKMSGRVRMLLFWIGRDDVGSGVIRWRGAGRRSRLRVADRLRSAARARQAESVVTWPKALRAGRCEIVGVMSKSTENGLSEVKANLNKQVAGRPFDTIRGRVTSNQAFARATTIQTEVMYHARDSDTVLGLTPGAAPAPTGQGD